MRALFLMLLVGCLITLSNCKTTTSELKTITPLEAIYPRAFSQGCNICVEVRPNEIFCTVVMCMCCDPENEDDFCSSIPFQSYEPLYPYDYEKEI